jgi:hypothetical protein
MGKECIIMPKPVELMITLLVSLLFASPVIAAPCVVTAANITGGKLTGNYIDEYGSVTKVKCKVGGGQRDLDASNNALFVAFDNEDPAICNGLYNILYPMTDPQSPAGNTAIAGEPKCASQLFDTTNPSLRITYTSMISTTDNTHTQPKREKGVIAFSGSGLYFSGTLQLKY